MAPLNASVAVIVALLAASHAFTSLPSFTTRSSTTSINLLFDRNEKDDIGNKKEQTSAQDERSTLEFSDLEPLEQTEARRQRFAAELGNREKFVEFGDELWDLREEMDNLSQRLVSAMTEGRDALEDHTRDRLREVESRDPELTYLLELTELEVATQEGRMEDAVRHRENALAARSCLPHFNLEGLWVGKYGSHGYEMINVTYVGDTLVAYKVTGDKNVPKGEITFQADLHPLRYTGNPTLRPEGALNPIQLTDRAAQKWGTRQLPRYNGLGQVAEEGFKNHQWMDGQLIIIGSDYFSFAWLPIEQQIFFGRPAPELALKMLRDRGTMRVFSKPVTSDDEVEVQMAYAQRCLEISDECFEDDGGSQVGCLWDNGDEECFFE